MNNSEIPKYINTEQKPSIFNKNESGPSMKIVACLVVALTFILIISLFIFFSLKGLVKHIMKQVNKK